MSTMTSAVANKLLRKYNEELQRKYNEESQCSTYTEVEGVNPLIPSYNFSEVRSDIKQLMDKIRKLKHAINVFNTTTVLQKFDMTIDEVLVYMSMLSKEKVRLEKMIVPNTKVINTGFSARNNVVEYTVYNYDVKDVRDKYDDVCELITTLQLELDLTNSTVTFDVDV